MHRKLKCIFVLAHISFITAERGSFFLVALDNIYTSITLSPAKLKFSFENVVWRDQVYYSSSNVLTNTTVIIKDKMLKKNFTIYFEIIKWNLAKSHAVKLKSAKYKTRVINKYLPTWMRNNHMSQSCSLSYYEILFLNFEKSFKGKSCLFLFERGWSVLIGRYSIKVTLLFVVRMQKS